eukprot:7382380-Prymnesium_polylepis.1
MRCPLGERGLGASARRASPVAGISCCRKDQNAARRDTRRQVVCQPAPLPSRQQVLCHIERHDDGVGAKRVGARCGGFGAIKHVDRKLLRPLGSPLWWPCRPRKGNVDHER